MTNIQQGMSNVQVSQRHHWILDIRFFSLSIIIFFYAESIMKTAYIGIGSNLGDKLAHCNNAIERLKKIEHCLLTGQSGWYSTEPVGVEDQDWYINGVAVVETSLAAGSLLQRLLEIEKDMGRVRRKRWDSREIDLDILLFDEEIIKKEDLIIPHPRLHERRFVLAPLAALAPGLVHPIMGLTMEELLCRLPKDEHRVVPIKV
jgi:2-amino-4-hydroxy-6-hydroxymethyldihydropteridine diphosphokinase